MATLGGKAKPRGRVQTHNSISEESCEQSPNLPQAPAVVITGPQVYARHRSNHCTYSTLCLITPCVMALRVDGNTEVLLAFA